VSNLPSEYGIPLSPDPKAKISWIIELEAIN
jgi:hypothetical protein